MPDLRDATGAAKRHTVLVTGTARFWESDGIRRARRLGFDLADHGLALTTGSHPGVDRAVSEGYCLRARQRKMDLSESFTQIKEPFTFWSWRNLASGYDAGAQTTRVSKHAWLDTAASRCDAAVMVGGRGFALTIAEHFLDLDKPVFPLPFAPGRSDVVFQRILETWSDRPVPGLTRNQFLRLSLPWAAAADSVMDLLIGALTEHPDIFISYRRFDAGWVAGRLQTELADHFGSKRVFSDVTHLRGGDVWRQTIDTTIAHAKVGIVVIGKDWLTAPGADGSARLLDDTDVVRREIRTLLDGKKRIIVVVADALAPNADALPDDLKLLAEIHAITVTHRDWTTDFQKVLAAVRSALRPPPL
jgi:hypothetical protein